MIGLAVTNASRSMRPLHGAHPRLGTNPIAFGAPAGQERPFLLDMATTTVASGKLGLARRLGVPISEGWAVDSEGVPITEPPAQRSEAWAQTPLGNTLEQGGHKGYGLAVIVDILAGARSGGGFSAQLAGGENMTWTMAVDIAAFRPVAEFNAMMDAILPLPVPHLAKAAQSSYAGCPPGKRAGDDSPGGLLCRGHKPASACSR